MDAQTAYAVLGIQPGCSLKDAQRAYRARALLFHPDRVEGRLRDEATAAMAQLNEALAVIKRHDAAHAFDEGSEIEPQEAPGAPPSAAQESDPRGPYWGECDMCGWQPARPVQFRQISGRLIWWQYRTLRLDLCRVCATGAFNEVQAHCLVKGWWGIIAVWVNLVTLLGNCVALRQHRRGLPSPEVRAPEVVTPMSTPSVTKPLGRRPLVWASPAVAAGLFAWAVSLGGGFHSPETTSTPSPSVTIGSGACISEAASPVDCQDPAAAYMLTSQVATSDDCPAGVTAWKDSAREGWFCSVKLK